MNTRVLVYAIITVIDILFVQTYSTRCCLPSQLPLSVAYNGILKLANACSQ